MSEQEEKYYQHIIDLPLRNFIPCAVDNNLSALIISGFPAPEKLQMAWIEIHQEYADAMGDIELQFIALLEWEVFQLDTKLRMIEWLVQILERFYSKYFAGELNKLLLTDFAFDWKDQEKYRHELQRCLNRSKGILLTYELKSIQLEELRKKNAAGKKPTRESYITILIALGNHAGHHIDDSICVFEYCTRFKQYMSYCREMEKLNKR